MYMKDELVIVWKWLGAAGQGLLLLVLIVVVGAGSLVASDFAQNRDHTTEAVREAVTSGSLSTDVHRRYGANHSNFSECIGLSISVRDSHADVLSSLYSNAILWQPPRSICDSLAAYLTGEKVKWFPYSRYWHGYRIFNQTFLSFVSFETLKWICLGTVMLSLGIWILVHARLFGYVIATGLGGMILLTTDIANVYITPTHAVSLSVMFLVTAGIARRAETGSFAEIVPWCWVAGAIYNFFDFLYNPDLLLLIVGTTLTVASLRRQDAIYRTIGQLLAGQIVVICGYVAMWLSKWLLVYAGRAIFAPVPWLPRADIARWIAGGDQPYVPFESMLTLARVSWQIGFNNLILPVFICAGVGLAVLLLLKGRWPVVLAFGLCALLPVVLLEAKATHTIAHAPFTFRTVPIAITFFALSMLWAFLQSRQSRQQTVLKIQ